MKNDELEALHAAIPQHCQGCGGRPSCAGISAALPSPSPELFAAAKAVVEAVRLSGDQTTWFAPLGRLMDAVEKTVPPSDSEGLERDRQWLMGAADALLCDISEQVGRSFDHATKRDDGECALCSKVADSLSWLLRGTVAALPQQDKNV